MTSAGSEVVRCTSASTCGSETPMDRKRHRTQLSSTIVDRVTIGIGRASDVVENNHEFFCNKSFPKLNWYHYKMLLYNNIQNSDLEYFL